MRFELIYNQLDPVLQAYVDSTARVSIIRGPLGSGKTVASCLKLFKIACNQRPNRQGFRKSRLIAIRNTFPDLLTTTVKDWLELYEELGKYKAGGISPPSHLMRFRLPDKTIVLCEMIFIALDRPQMVKKLRGVQATYFWLNELKELEKSVVDMADFRHGRYPSMIDGGPSAHGMIGDTNSPDDDHWLYEQAEEIKPKDWAFFVQPGGLLRELVEVDGRQEWTGKWLVNEKAENIQNLPKNYYSAGMEGKTTDWIAVNLANEYGSVHDGQPIYKHQWNDALHVSDRIELIEDSSIIIGLDFGLMPAAIIGQETPRGGVNILEEIVSEGMGIEQFTEECLMPILRKSYKSCEWNFVGDPAGNKRAETDENTVFKTLADLGIDAEEANTNDPLIRWEAVRYFLQQLRDGKPAFRLHPRCKVLRKGFNGGYKLKRLQITGTTRYSTKADKNKYSHPHDGLQYLCMYVRGESRVPKNEFSRTEENRWSQ